MGEDDKQRKAYADYARDALHLKGEDIQHWADQKVAFERDRQKDIDTANNIFKELTEKAIPNATELTLSNKIGAINIALMHAGEDHRLLVPEAKSEEEALKTIEKKLRELYPGKDFPDLTPIEKTPLVFKSKDIQHWTAEYVREEQLTTEAQLQSAVTAGGLVKLEDWAKGRQDLVEMFKAYEETAKAIGIDRPTERPVIYVDPSMDVHMIGSGITKEGRNFVFITEPVLEHATVADQRQLLAHEFTHIKNKDTSPEEKAREHNEKDRGKNTQHQRDKEYRADLGSVSLGDPQATIATLKKWRGFELSDYRKENPGKTEADFISEQENHPNSDHPSAADRIKRIEASMKEKPKERAPDAPSKQSSNLPDLSQLILAMADVITHGPPLDTRAAKDHAPSVPHRK